MIKFYSTFDYCMGKIEHKANKLTSLPPANLLIC